MSTCVRAGMCQWRDYCIYRYVVGIIFRTHIVRQTKTSSKNILIDVNNKKTLPENYVKHKCKQYRDTTSPFRANEGEAAIELLL
jgi:hypothetical protein